MKKYYGYCRVSTKNQNIERQIENILKIFPESKIFQETYTGTTINRKEWNRLKKILKSDDTIIFDSVSRMSRSADEGVKEYLELLDKGVNLVFLKERYIDTEVYQEQLKANESLQIEDTDINDTIMRGIREYLKRLATRQIRIAFEQSEKEVLDLKERTKEGLKVAKGKGSVIGRPLGKKIETKKSKEMKTQISKLSKAFGGSLKDKEILVLLKIDKNTYYKYKKEIIAELEEKTTL